MVTLKPLFTDSGSCSSGKNPTSSDDDEQLLSVSQDCLNVSVFDMNGLSIRSINLPWYGKSMYKHTIQDIKIKDYWLYVFTKYSFEVFVFDLHRIAFVEIKNP